MRHLNWLKLPVFVRECGGDNPHSLEIQKKIIAEKGFLKNLYKDWYTEFGNEIKGLKNGLVIELGSGGGFIKDVIPEAVTSDILLLSGIDLNLSVLEMPFKNNLVDAFFMLDVLHHVKEPEAFFRELERCLKVGGKVIMIEPANTVWSRFIYRYFHREPFDDHSGWRILGEGGPLTCANSAIPLIIFFRDRQRFEQKFPSLRIRRLYAHTPLRYLISGGVSMCQLLPSWTYPVIKKIEAILSPFDNQIGMFLTIEIEKKES